MLQKDKNTKQVGNATDSLFFGVISGVFPPTGKTRFVITTKKSADPCGCLGLLLWWVPVRTHTIWVKFPVLDGRWQWALTWHLCTFCCISSIRLGIRAAEILLHFVDVFPLRRAPGVEDRHGTRGFYSLSVN